MKKDVADLKKVVFQVIKSDSKPNKDEIMPYLNEFHEKLLSKTDSKLIIFGPQQLEIKTDNLPDKIELYRSVESFMSNYFIQTILS